MSASGICCCCCIFTLYFFRKFFGLSCSNIWAATMYAGKCIVKRSLTLFSLHSIKLNWFFRRLVSFLICWFAKYMVTMRPYQFIVSSYLLACLWAVFFALYLFSSVHSFIHYKFQAPISVQHNTLHVAFYQRICYHIQKNFLLIVSVCSIENQSRRDTRTIQYKFAPDNSTHFHCFIMTFFYYFIKYYRYFHILSEISCA